MLKTQNITSSDYNLVIDQLNDWWGGRQMTDMLPRLFFKHFQESSFIIKDKEQVLGFLIGFISQSNPQIAYVHFIGVNPNFRNKHIGRTLYSTFFETVKNKGARQVECVTSPSNISSVNFHKQIGFNMIEGDSGNEQGLSYFKDYDGPNEHRVLLQFSL